MGTFTRLACLWLALVLLAGCDARPGSAHSAPPEDRVPAVATVKPERRTLRHVIDQPGTLEAFEQTPLVAKIPGHVQKVHCDIGDLVSGPGLDAKGKETKPGQALAELWMPEMVEEHRQKQALVEQAKAEVEQAKGALEAAEANVATTTALVQEAEAARVRAQASLQRWQSEYQRIAALVKNKIIDQQTQDETKNQLTAAEATKAEVEARLRSAQATVRESQARRNKALADMAVARARVRVVQAEEARLAALLQYATIRAPYTGVVIQRNVHTGHLVQPGQGNDRPLFVVARTDRLRVHVEVPEDSALLVKKDLPARIRVAAIKDRDFEGKVSRTTWSLDPRVRTLRLEIDLTNTGDLLLRPGMYAQITLVNTLVDRWTVPATAVLTQGEQTSCFRVENGKALRTPVKLGLRGGTLVELLKKQMPPSRPNEEVRWENISGEEVFIVGNLGSLTDGQAVKVAPAGK